MEEKKEIKINIPPGIVGGVYSNGVRIHHTQEEFMLDFIIITPEGGVVNSRVFVSPGHIIRMIKALQDNVKQYESKFETIKEAKPLKGIIDTKIKPA